MALQVLLYVGCLCAATNGTFRMDSISLTNGGPRAFAACTAGKDLRLQAASPDTTSKCGSVALTGTGC